MQNFKETPGIPEDFLQLLEACGIRSTADLAAQDADHLLSELNIANHHLQITNLTLKKSDVAEWISKAKTLAGGPTSPTPLHLKPPVNYEDNPEVAEALSLAPFAIPLPGKILMEKGLRVSDIPAALLLNCYEGELDICMDEPSTPKINLPAARPGNYTESVTKPIVSRPIESASASVAEPPTTYKKRSQVEKSGQINDLAAPLRKPSEGINRGVDPSSRRFIRGMLHPHPWRLRAGAIFSLLLLLNLPLAIVSPVLLLASREYPDYFSWVRFSTIIFPLALPITLLGYLIWGMSGRCRVCTQKFFVHKGALKHTKSHQLLGMGYVVPLSLHLLTFSWFRCSSCGTPIRLKK
jgi:hypothetical protein